MCDYSLAGIPNRLAVESEELVVHRFSTGSIGLASPCASVSSRWSAKQNPAVCVPPGARLILLDVPKRLQHDMVVGPIDRPHGLLLRNGNLVDCTAGPRFREAAADLCEGILPHSGSPRVIGQPVCGLRR